MVPGALLIRAPEVLTVDVELVPIMFVAEMRTSTRVSKVKLNGLVVNVDIGMIQVREFSTVLVLPSQLESETQVDVEVLTWIK